uniref:DDE Tnp4 domain-containing protein n=1 Tax=Anopheles epiroticus TaxID=199890 RepID=A0A182PX58_9DIPT
MYEKRSALSHTNLIRELRLEPSDWQNYLRMEEASYLWLLKQISSSIKRENTQLRTSITPHERLSATLRFLISGGTYSDLKFRTAISQPSLTHIIPETCRAIIKVLKNFIKLPRNTHEWKNAATTFNQKWQFPNCVGAVDGKLVRIASPAGSGSKYFNYKKFNSIVLMAVVDAEYKFMMCDVGGPGSESDAAFIQTTEFYKKLETGRLNLPDDQSPANSTQELPFVFVGDEAFALRKDFLKPFSKKQLNYE